MAGDIPALNLHITFITVSTGNICIQTFARQERSRVLDVQKMRGGSCV